MKSGSWIRWRRWMLLVARSPKTGPWFTVGVFLCLRGWVFKNVFKKDVNWKRNLKSWAKWHLSVYLPVLGGWLTSGRLAGLFQQIAVWNKLLRPRLCAPVPLLSTPGLDSCQSLKPRIKFALQTGSSERWHIILWTIQNNIVLYTVHG